MYKAVIVDDEPVIVSGISKALEWEGFHFEIAMATTKPLEALEYIKQNTVHLLITDISMPEMNGIALIRAVKEVDSKIAVLVLSAFNDFEYVRSAMCSGAENYLLKPLNKDEMVQSVSQIVAHLEKRETLYEQYGTKLLTFRSSFVESWVKGSLTGTELTERAEMLGVNLEESSWQVVILTIKDGDEAGMAELFDLFLARMIGQVTGHFYFETPSELVCVLTPLVKKAAGAGTFIRKLLAETSKTRRGIRVFASIGPAVNDCMQVSKSFREAHNYLFLQYTDTVMEVSSMGSIRGSLRKLVEVEFDGMDKAAYIALMKRLLNEEQDVEKRKNHVYCIIANGLRQLEYEKKDILEDNAGLRALLGELPKQDTERALADYIEAWLKECFRIWDKSRKEYIPCVETVIRKIRDFATKDISLQSLADSLNISAPYLGSLFKQQTGYYFNDYLNQARITYSAQLITTTDMKMKDIVDKAGFSSQAYFNRLFKQYYNLSPMAYRQQESVHKKRHS